MIFHPKDDSRQLDNENQSAHRNQQNPLQDKVYQYQKFCNLLLLLQSTDQQDLDFEIFLQHKVHKVKGISPFD